VSGKDVMVHSDGLDGMGRRFVAAWHAAERGEAVQRDHLTFPDLARLLSVLSPKRLELLKALRKAGPQSVRRLSVLLKRDYKAVHQDVALLATHGLIDRPGPQEVSVPWRMLVSELDLAA
jgi:predicted transcriptional regulator